MATAFIKEEAHRLIDGLPDDATWDDVLHQFALRRDNCSSLPKPSLRELLSRITDENRHTEVDFGPSVGKETW